MKEAGISGVVTELQITVLPFVAGTGEVVIIATYFAIEMRAHKLLNLLFEEGFMR